MTNISQAILMASIASNLRLVLPGHVTYLLLDFMFNEENGSGIRINSFCARSLLGFQLVDQGKSEQRLFCELSKTIICKAICMKNQHWLVGKVLSSAHPWLTQLWSNNLDNDMIRQHHFVFVFMRVCHATENKSNFKILVVKTN